MKRVCKYCGKTIPQNKSFWITIENDGFLEGMEDHIFSAINSVLIHGKPVFCVKNRVKKRQITKKNYSKIPTEKPQTKTY